MYTFKNMCVENQSILLGDAATKIFINTKGQRGDVSEDLKSFLKYVEKGIVDGSFVESIDGAVNDVKIARETRLSFMTLEQEFRRREKIAFKKGFELGIHETRRNAVRKMWELKLPLKIIKKVTNLSVEKIKEIAGEKT